MKLQSITEQFQQEVNSHSLKPGKQVGKKSGVSVYIFLAVSHSIHTHTYTHAVYKHRHIGECTHRHSHR